MRPIGKTLLAAICLGGLSAPAIGFAATTAATTASAPGGPDAGATSGDKLTLFFGTGQSALSAENEAVLDKAARLYRDALPVIMIVSGGSDSVGTPVRNLYLSNQRAFAVARGLVARGIPAERTQVLAKGETNPAIDTQKGTPEAQNRRVEITWSTARQ